MEKAKRTTPVCSQCGEKPGRLTCSRCWRASYCGGECQKAAWRCHKRNCVDPWARLGPAGERLCKTYDEFALVLAHWKNFVDAVGARPVATVGCGNGSITTLLNQIYPAGGEITYLDPQPNSYQRPPTDPSLRAAVKKKTLPQVLKKSPELRGGGLVLIWPEPNDLGATHSGTPYDVEALALLNPRAVFVFYGSIGSAGSGAFCSWAGRVPGHLADPLEIVLAEGIRSPSPESLKGLPRFVLVSSTLRIMHEDELPPASAITDTNLARRYSLGNTFSRVSVLRNEGAPPGRVRACPAALPPRRLAPNPANRALIEMADSLLAQCGGGAAR